VGGVTNVTYSADSRNNRIAVFNGVTGVIGSVPVVPIPFTVAVNPVTNKIYTAGLGIVNMTMIDASRTSQLPRHARSPKGHTTLN
jgi:DNA-binding beta-propeller fold protein YncE